MLTPEVKKQVKSNLIKMHGEERGWSKYQQWLAEQNVKPKPEPKPVPPVKTKPLTNMERREKALRHFISVHGPDQGPVVWEAYCKKAKLIDAEAPTPGKGKGSKSG